MSAKAIHVNLLRENEVLSSSPVRLRVMIPVAMMLAAAGMALWWVIVYGAVLLNVSSISTIESDIAAKKTGHQMILSQMNEALELEAELEQLGYYRASRRTWGDTLAHLAEIVPLKVQLTKLAIPPPPPQDLSRPKGSKLPPLWGPDPKPEKVTMVLAGRTTKETPVISMMESLESDVFTNALVICRDPGATEQSPRVKSFRQDAATGSDSKQRQRMLSFEIEYTARERSFGL